MQEKTVLVERAEGVVRVTMNRPQAKNALDPAMTDQLTTLFTSLAREEEARVVVLAGAGGDFCSGGDLRAAAAAGPRTHEQRRAGMRRYQDLVNAILDLDKPVIAAVDGVAFGAGFSLALLADLVLVSRRARFCMVFNRIGFVPDVGALYTLPRVVGVQRARELIFSAREVSADEALAMGLALEVVEADALMPRVMELASAFTGASPVAMSLSKRALQMSQESDVKTMLEYEASAQALAAGSDYAAEAIRRFGAKEPPQFRWPARNPSSQE